MIRLAAAAGVAYLAGRYVAPRLTEGAPSMWTKLGTAAALGLAAWLAYPTVVDGTPMLGDGEDCGCGG